MLKAAGGGLCGLSRENAGGTGQARGTLGGQRGLTHTTLTGCGSPRFASTRVTFQGHFRARSNDWTHLWPSSLLHTADRPHADAPGTDPHLLPEGVARRGGPGRPPPAARASRRRQGPGGTQLREATQRPERAPWRRRVTRRPQHSDAGTRRLRAPRRRTRTAPHRWECG